MDDFNKSQVRQRLGRLLDARRQRFTYVNKTTGEFEEDHVVFLNGLAGCFFIPTLFYIAMYTLVITKELAIQPINVLSVLFISAACSILFDLIIGFIFDKLTIHAQQIVRYILSVIGTVGFWFAAIYFFRTSVETAESIVQFRWCFVGFGVFYSMANLGHFTNSMNYTPSQEGRTVLFYNELLIQACYLAAFCCTPIVAKLIGDGCNCENQCEGAPGANECVTCYKGCDTFTSYTGLQTICIIFSGISGIANVFVTFYVNCRNDQETEFVHSTFFSRILDVVQNIFLFKIFLVGLVEAFLLFGFGVWLSYVLTVDVTVSAQCLTDNFDGLFGGYVCTKSFLLEFGLGLLILLALIVRQFCAKTNVMLGLWTYSPVIALAIGIVILASHKFAAFEAIVTAIYVIVLFTGTAMTKLFYSDAIFYDEYQTGSSRPFFPSSVYLLGYKLGFICSLAYFYTLFDNDYNNNVETLTNATLNGFSICLIAASAVLLALKIWISTYNLHAFDKIHLAIERNTSPGNRDDISFYDPIAKDEIRKPINGETSNQKKLMAVLNNLKRSDIVDIFRKKVKPSQLADGAKFWMWIIGALFIIDTWLTVFRFDYLVVRASAWWLLLGMCLMPILLLCFIYQYNVYAASTRLEATTFLGVESSFLTKVAQSYSSKDDL